jgi:uncharacterized protein (UPF0212 family)
MNCRVVVEAAVPVYDVDEPDDAVSIAISKTGKMLNPDLNYVEISAGERSCPHCGEPLETAFTAADESLVALELEMDVFNVDGEEHARRIARKEIGGRMENVPLVVLDVEEPPDEEDEPDETESESESEGNSGSTDGADDASADEEILPEFDEMLEDEG